MTDTTTKPWMPVLVFNRNDENCAVCGTVLTDNYLASITVGVNAGGSACKECTEAIPGVGEGLWNLAEALDTLDSAIFQMPQSLRASMTKVAHDMLDKILEWRIGPITDEEKAEHVAAMAEQDKFLTLPGGRMVKAAIYDPKIHGPFLP